MRRLRPGKAFWAGEQRCEGGRRGRGWGGAASCPRFSWWGTVGPSSGLSVVLSSDVFLPSASAHPILRSFLREASLGFSDRGGSPAPACSAHLCRDASVCWFICVAPPPLTLTHTHQTVSPWDWGRSAHCPQRPAHCPPVATLAGGRLPQAPGPANPLEGWRTGGPGTHGPRPAAPPPLQGSRLGEEVSSKTLAFCFFLFFPVTFPCN